MKEPIKMEIVYKPIDDLIPSEYNPRKCSPKEYEDIKASIKRFGLVDPAIINIHPTRTNIIVGGHRRTEVAKDLGYTEMPCIEVNLPFDSEKELNVRLNKNTASFDENKLSMHFTKDFLKEVGFFESELKMFLSDFEKKFEQFNNMNCAYPLVPKFSEKYDALIIVSTNSIDSSFLETVLEISTAQSYKNSRTGKAMIIDVSHFRKAWESR